MGLLEDLQRQAEGVLASQRTSQESLNAKVQAAHARLNEALHYWVQVFKSLNIIKPPVYRNYFIEGSTQLTELLQGDYGVNGRRRTVDHRDYIESVVLTYTCIGTAARTIEKESQALVERLREHLWSHGLKFDVREMRGPGAYVERAAFSINPHVAVTLAFAADMERSEIVLTTRNLERLGEFSYRYGYDEFGPPLLEEIGKAILGQPHRLRSLGRAQSATLVSRRGASAA